jgi:YidC/Oxa1 family membrane protein insertase
VIPLADTPGLTWIEQALTEMLVWLHTSLSLSWAWAIVALTVAIRILIVPLTIKQIRSMQKLQIYAPQLKALQQKYKHDKQRLNEEVMRFYRENKVNPAASCLPILPQVPIFIALFFVLRDFREEVYPDYRGSDLGWLGIFPDITADIGASPWDWLLVALYVASQVASTLFMSTTMERTQRIIFMLLPFVFVYFIVNPPGNTVFPLGLLVYWVTTNLWTVGQGLITRRLIPKPAAVPAKRSSRAQPRAEVEAAAAPDEARPAGAAQPRVRRRKKRKGSRSAPRR